MGGHHRKGAAVNTEVNSLLFLVCQACQNWHEESDGKDSMWSLFQQQAYYPIFVSWKGCDLALAARHLTGDRVECVSGKQRAG